MKERHGNQEPLADMIRSQREEIEKHRWIESEKTGRDIGWERAAKEWKQKYFVEWKRFVRARGGQHPFAEILWSQQEEIERYKWIESEKKGHDIGWRRAVMEWQQRHYPEWKTNVLLGGQDSAPHRRPNSSGDVSIPENVRPKREITMVHRQKLTLALKAWWEKRGAADAK
jgi:hypothetical protein